MDNDIVGDLIKAKIRISEASNEEIRELVAVTRKEIVKKKSEGGRKYRSYTTAEI